MSSKALIAFKKSGSCRSGPDARALLNQQRPGQGKARPCKLTDVHMLGLDGNGLAAIIRQSEPAGSRSPIVGLSADVPADDVERCRSAGVAKLALEKMTGSSRPSIAWVR